MTVHAVNSQPAALPVDICDPTPLVCVDCKKVLAFVILIAGKASYVYCQHCRIEMVVERTNLGELVIGVTRDGGRRR
jgi:hypothetical protein